jgi:hypothetical protein
VPADRCSADVLSRKGNRRAVSGVVAEAGAAPSSPRCPRPTRSASPAAPSPAPYRADGSARWSTSSWPTAESLPATIPGHRPLMSRPRQTRLPRSTARPPEAHDTRRSGRQPDRSSRSRRPELGDRCNHAPRQNRWPTSDSAYSLRICSTKSAMAAWHSSGLVIYDS